MAPSDIQCKALVAAMNKSGSNYEDIGKKLGKSTQYVEDICTGKKTPTTQEFDDLAKVLGIVDAPPHDVSHATK